MPQVKMLPLYRDSPRRHVLGKRRMPVLYKHEYVTAGMFYRIGPADPFNFHNGIGIEVESFITAPEAISVGPYNLYDSIARFGLDILELNGMQTFYLDCTATFDVGAVSSLAAVLVARSSNYGVKDHTSIIVDAVLTDDFPITKNFSIYVGQWQQVTGVGGGVQLHIDQQWLGKIDFQAASFLDTSSHLTYNTFFLK